MPMPLENGELSDVVIVGQRRQSAGMLSSSSSPWGFNCPFFREALKKNRKEKKKKLSAPFLSLVRSLALDPDTDILVPGFCSGKGIAWHCRVELTLANAGFIIR
jgi:hypothetical protein